MKTKVFENDLTKQRDSRNLYLRAKRAQQTRKAHVMGYGTITDAGTCPECGDTMSNFDGFCGDGGMWCNNPNCPEPPIKATHEQALPNPLKPIDKSSVPTDDSVDIRNLIDAVRRMKIILLVSIFFSMVALTVSVFALIHVF